MSCPPKCFVPWTRNGVVLRAKRAYHGVRDCNAGSEFTNNTFSALPGLQTFATIYPGILLKERSNRSISWHLFLQCYVPCFPLGIMVVTLGRGLRGGVMKKLQGFGPKWACLFNAAVSTCQCIIQDIQLLFMPRARQKLLQLFLQPEH